MHYELGGAYTRLGRPQDAAESYRSALRFRPHNVPALINLSAVLAGLPGRLDEAAGRRRAAIDVAPYFYVPYYHLGQVELALGRPGEARALLARSLERNPEHGPSSYYLGKSFVVAREPMRALEHFRRARDLGFDVGGGLREQHPSLEGEPAFAEFFR
jgi:tetratricopeptide (TPR) repeat protein